MNQRRLFWEGCVNTRDLGGLRTTGNRITRSGAIVRSDTPTRLTEAGWSELHAYGIRTIVSLHTFGIEEEGLTVTPPFPDVFAIRAAIEDFTDKVFVQQWVDTSLWGTPLYYRDALERWPQRHAAAISAIARARPGGVLFHCVRGYDRTGIITLLLLSLVGVVPEDIVADYMLSVDPIREELLAREHSSVPEALLGAVAGLDVADYLKSGGATQEDLDAIRRRLLG